MKRRDLFKGALALIAAPFLSRFAKAEQPSWEDCIAHGCREVFGAGYKRGESITEQAYREVAESEKRVQAATGVVYWEGTRVPRSDVKWYSSESIETMKRMWR